jgi:hypothetical protein
MSIIGAFIMSTAVKVRIVVRSRGKAEQQKAGCKGPPPVQMLLFQLIPPPTSTHVRIFIMAEGAGDLHSSHG